jgi:hypothetical protein
MGGRKMGEDYELDGLYTKKTSCALMPHIRENNEWHMGGYAGYFTAARRVNPC